MTPEQLSDALVAIFMKMDKLNLYRNLAPRLTAKETDILMTLYFHELEYGESLTIKGISTTYRITNATTIQFVNALEREGYVERQQDSRDKRVTHIVLTEFGTRVAKLVDTDHHHVMADIIAQEGESLEGSIAQIHRVLDTIEQIPPRQLILERTDNHAGN